MGESRMGLVMVHGIMSGPEVWEPLRKLIAADRDLEFVEPLAFEYATGLLSVNPLRVFPSIDTVADSLKEYLATEAGAFDQLLLVTHSQGGLVAQRYLARMLHDGRGAELARIHRLVMIACPSNGSELLLSLRRRALGLRHPQEKDLRPLNDQVSSTLRTVLRDVVHATAVTDRTCPIPVSVYAGESDGVVPRSSAQSVFPDSSALPGDHSSILKADSPRHRTFTALRRLILVTHTGSHTTGPPWPGPLSSPPEPPAPEPATGPVAPFPAKKEPAGKQGRAAIAFGAVAVLAAAALVLHFAPMPWDSDANSSDADTKPSAADTESSVVGTGSSTPSPAGKKSDVTPPEKFPATNMFWLVEIDGENGGAEYLTVDKSQHFRFWWNGGVEGDRLMTDGAGINSYTPDEGADGAALRFGDIDGDEAPDCMVVDRTGGVTAYTWVKGGEKGKKMCKKRHDNVERVSFNGSPVDIPDIKQIQFADINGDGRVDYLRIEPDRTATVWYNEGFSIKDGVEQLGWSPGVEISAASGEPRETMFADINGDGYADQILITSKGGAQAWINEGVEDSRVKLRDIGEIVSDTGAPPQEIQFADVDGDKKAEFLHIDKTGAVRVWHPKL